MKSRYILTMAGMMLTFALLTGCGAGPAGGNRTGENATDAERGRTSGGDRFPKGGTGCAEKCTGYTGGVRNRQFFFTGFGKYTGSEFTEQQRCGAERLR